MSSQKDRILVIDLGTTNCKSSLFRLDGQIDEHTSVPIRTYRSAAGWAEQDPREWWDAVVNGVRELVACKGSDMTNLVAIVVTGQMHAVVAVGEDGEALGPCATLADTRSVAEANRILEVLSLEEIRDLVGARLGPFAPVAKISWLRHNKPLVYDDVKVFLPPKDFIRYRLTSQIATDPIDAAGMLLFDIRKRTYSLPLLDAAIIDASKLPPVLEPTELAGHLSTWAAAELNLPSGIAVPVGAGDDIDFLGLGGGQPGIALEHLGSTASIMLPVDDITPNLPPTLDIYPSIQSDLWFLGGSTNNAGTVLAWGQSLLYGGPIEPKGWSRLRKDWCSERLQPLVFLPYFQGERCPVWDPHAVGILFGLTGRHTRDDVMRSIFEGVGFALRHILEAIEAAELSVDAVAAAEEDPLDWTRIRASIYNRTMVLADVQDPTALGAMILAGVAIGAFEDPWQAAKEIVKIARVIEPVEELVEHFCELYQTYRELYLCTQPLLTTRH